MPSLHDRLATRTKLTSCKTCFFLDGLPQADREEWERELSLPTAEIGNEAVVEAINQIAGRGYVTTSSVKRHRQRHAR